MKTLEKCENLFGKISPQIQKRIKNYIKKPTFDNWDDIQCIIISGNMKTIWQAVIEIDPTFPRRGRSEDLEGNIVKEWERIPEPFIVLQAIKQATSFNQRRDLY